MTLFLIKLALVVLSAWTTVWVQRRYAERNSALAAVLPAVVAFGCATAVDRFEEWRGNPEPTISVSRVADGFDVRVDQVANEIERLVIELPLFGQFMTIENLGSTRDADPPETVQSTFRSRALKVMSPRVDPSRFGTQEFMELRVSHVRAHATLHYRVHIQADAEPWRFAGDDRAEVDYAWAHGGDTQRKQCFVPIEGMSPIEGAASQQPEGCFAYDGVLSPDDMRKLVALGPPRDIARDTTERCSNGD